MLDIGIDLDRTHDAAARSWLPTAQVAGTDFPIQNLPLGIFRCGTAGSSTPGLAIGDQVLDLSAALNTGLFDGQAAQAVRWLQGGRLNPLMAADPAFVQALREAAFDLLVLGSPEQARAQPCLRAMAAVQMLLPADVGDFSDFSVSRAHNATLGKVAQREVALHNCQNKKKPEY